MILKEYGNVLESDENNTEKQIRNSPPLLELITKVLTPSQKAYDPGNGVYAATPLLGNERALDVKLHDS